MRKRSIRSRGNEGRIEIDKRKRVREDKRRDTRYSGRGRERERDSKGQRKA